MIVNVNENLDINTDMVTYIERTADGAYRVEFPYSSVVITAPERNALIHLSKQTKLPPSPFIKHTR